MKERGKNIIKKTREKQRKVINERTRGIVGGERQKPKKTLEIKKKNERTRQR